MELPATVLAAGATATLAYLDAKFHVRKDIASLRGLRNGMAEATAAAKANRWSLFYPFEEQALRLKDEQCLWYRNTAQSSEAVTYSWTETYQMALRWAGFLAENGVKPGEMVGTYLQNSPECVFNLIGSWAIGCAPALINYNLAGEGLIHCLKLAGTRVLIVDEEAECAARIEEVRERIEGELGMRIVILDAETRAAIAARQPVRPDDSMRAKVTGPFPMFLLYTSGTTGLPKAFAFQIQRQYGSGASLSRNSGLKSGPNGDIWYDCMPLYHGTGIVTLCSAMLHGVGVAIGRKFSVRNFWPDIHDSRANGFIYVGETARYLLAADPSPLDKGHALKAMYGNGLRPDVWAKFQERFAVPNVNEFFNSTEGMFGLLNVCKGPFHTAHVGHQGGIRRFLSRNLYVPVEIDHENGSIYRDPQTGFATRTPYETGGEMLVKLNAGAEFPGYWGNEGATNKKLERDVFVKGDIYYRTGDALRRDADGRWYFLDRLGDTFRWKSENVSTAEVAEVLGRFPGLVESNVYGVEVPGYEGRAGCAAVYIPPAEREKFDMRALLAFARKELPKYAVPVFLRRIESPTPMHNNKQNKVPLRNEGVDPVKIQAGEAGPGDLVLWARPGADSYETFGEKEWKEVVAGKMKL